MPTYKCKWKQQDREGTMKLNYKLDPSTLEVKVQIDGEIPDVMKFNDQVPSKEASKRALEILYAGGIRRLFLNRENKMRD